LRSGEIALERERRHLADVVGAAIASLGAILGKHRIEVQVPADLPAVSVDPRLMQRVFASLIGNVAKHTPAGTSAKIEAHRARGAIEVSVADEGPGLPRGREEEVFESFARGERQGARRGAGLGLAISRAIVEAHGGTIRAEAGRDKGARFVITLPVTPA
jgi:two-component system, OmpR family, sensor histidine kinase KdpD